MKGSILHIINDFAGSAVYKNLVHEIDRMGVFQTIYTPVRNQNQVNKNWTEFELPASRIYYRNILKLNDRFLFKKKIWKIVRDIEQTLDLDKINLIHAHTWFSDGAVAFELSKKMNVPYIIAVRNTDLNVFFKYMFHLRSYGYEILQNAEKIIFITPRYQERLFELSEKNLISEIQKKSMVIPNGIDSYWLENINLKKNSLNQEIQLLYIGKFSNGKNLFKLCKAVELLNLENISCKLNIVGGGGNEERKILKFIRDKKYFHYYGKIYDKEQLKTIFRNCDIFTMPSKYETFGLVYIEALTQGLPIIYSVNEGIYGFFDSTVGEAVNPHKTDSIYNGIKKIINNYEKYNFNINSFISNHNWSKIARKYYSVYKKLS